MPPKSRKSITPWFKCDACESILTSKDLPLHEEKSCPPADDCWLHGFIKKKVLHSFLEQLKSTDTVKYVPSDEKNNILLLSQSALQICEICIGDPVIVTIGDEINIFKAWPTIEKSLTSVSLSKEAIDQISKGVGDLVVVKKLESPPLPAQEVVVERMQDLDVPPDLTHMLSRLHQGRIVCKGNSLFVPFYGKKMRFKISRIISSVAPGCDDAESLVQKLDEMSICSKDHVTFYKIFESTKWSIDGTNEELPKPIPVNFLERIGGLNDVIIELQELINLALGAVAPIMGLKATRGILLHGISGSGKTLLAKALASKAGVNVVAVNGPEVYSKFFGETESKLKDIFDKAKKNAPSIILLDDLDSLCPRRNANVSDQEKRVVATLLSQLDGLHEPVSGVQVPVLVLATSRQPDSIDRALRRPGRLDREVEIPVPSPSARCEILGKMLAGVQHDLSSDDVRSVASAAHGFVGADLAALCSRAAAHAAARFRSDPPNRSALGSDTRKCSERPALDSEPESRSEDVACCVALADMEFALTCVKPSAMREVLVEVPSVRWTDIGGQHELKLKLRQAVEWPLKHPESFARLGICPPRGVLMFGPPGCSKTMIAKALATESKLNFLSIKGPELFSKWVGESERAVREVFRRARQVAPSVVFFDELDALAGERSVGDSGGGSNVQERVLAQLLTELDGVEPLGNVTVVGATNRPDRIDKALLRPGRLDRVVYVPLPDAETRAEIFALQLRKMPTGADVDVAHLVRDTEGYSGAEVLAVCHEAALKALEENLEASAVSRRHFEAALALVTPRTPPALLELYRTYLQR